ncbi:Protein phosphatase PP2A regulatory subunit B [Entomortierella beljakovae]|nr:Protein phosphatase PP2A regulatory subunit B [Entomortierella beljakovae]
MPEQGFKTIMGIRHKTLPHHGVQFHPESICSQYGKNMMKNFFNISCQFYQNQSKHPNTKGLPDHIKAISVISNGPITNPSPPTLPIPKKKTNPYSLLIRSLDPSIFPDPESVFSSLFLTSPKSNAASWWLDSARQPHPMSRFSFMGGIDTRNYQGLHSDSQSIAGSSQAVIQYSSLHKEIHVRRYKSTPKESDIKRIKLNDTTNTGTGDETKTFWDWVSNTMEDFSKDNIETTVIGSGGEELDFDEVPFDFFAGMIGYFGYEMKRESLDGYHTPAEQRCSCLGHSEDVHSCSCSCLRQPDAAFILATQAIVFDHVEKRLYALGVVNNFGDREHKDVGVSLGFQSREACQNWIQGISQSIEYIASEHSMTKRPRHQPAVTLENISKNGEPYHVRQIRRRRSSVSMLSPCRVDVAEEDYIKAIQDSLNYIHEGESYELCLTTQFRTKLPLKRKYIEYSGGNGELIDGGDPAFDLYRIIRKLNPAPFSTFMSIPTAINYQSTEGHLDQNADNQTDGLIGKLIVLSSSPERFLKIGRKPVDESRVSVNVKDTLNSRTVEMKPIKGTVAVAKGCFCKEDEGCKLDDDSSSGHDDEDSSISDGNQNCRSGDKCTEARKRENQHRVDSLSRNIKERAENLMIVDLIRNDLAQVCRSESVRVPYLMNVESYETVHQLVTTVRGELFDHVDSAQAIRACFPPGSMTGAPKLRSVQLLDSLENNVRRGVYSGCIGYIGFPAVAADKLNANLTSGDNSNNNKVQRKIRSAVDFAVVIRTAVLAVTPNLDTNGKETLFADLSVGAGGALTILSDAKEEWREVLLKSRSVVPSVLTYLHQDAKVLNS